MLSFVCAIGIRAAGPEKCAVVGVWAIAYGGTYG